eukprot:CAMPEP_0180672554 /NCGR_PEP_ID=MMETSP1037_2-20121125/65197_1 /TAXON_ID=632150 /ORGANISM="Azadinium spinosum, Strain 3D9" /LENGTH=61 /DNA_ID=CAMNT_0022701711 /DNA_START=109 /DNA_END=290 /DNA_ORIENTATION=-
MTIHLRLCPYPLYETVTPSTFLQPTAAASPLGDAASPPALRPQPPAPARPALARGRLRTSS